ncbi:MAG: shikimate dehydrogenase [Gammaproteobacteria bacterium]|nr:MAG: shikimate dehydrogenase [Gammaproteobacteria bacterium]
MGDPVAHSKSPRIHTLFAAQTGQAIRYEARRVPAGQLAGALRAFRAEGGRGCNITVPLKEEAFRLADHPTGRVLQARAANTLWFRDGIHADNTDGIGLLRDLRQNLGWEVGGMRLLILGAGGAVRGILGPLLEQGPELVVIANRTVRRARELAGEFAACGPVDACGFEALAGRRFDLVINGTSASLGGELPPLPEGLLAEGARCYDLMYAARPTPFLAWAAQWGAATSDGLGMLVEQAAESFCIWRGVRPDTAPVIALLRREMGG